MKQNVVKFVNFIFSRKVYPFEIPRMLYSINNNNLKDVFTSFWKFNRCRFHGCYYKPTGPSFTNGGEYSKRIAIGLLRKIKSSFSSFNLIYGNFNRYKFKFSTQSPTYTCFVVGACLFSWTDNYIEDDVFTDCLNEMRNLHNSDTNSCQIDDTWEKLMEKENLILWRRPLKDSHLYEYKVYGKFDDISARNFLQVNIDLEYRKQWDTTVIKLDVIDKDPNSSSQVVQWICYYPFPMASREYVYVRKSKIKKKANVMISATKAIDHPQCPITNKYVRVGVYESQMIIKPLTTFDADGLEYILTYHDDPQAVFPSSLCNWMASTGVPDFVEYKLHDAALRLKNSLNNNFLEYYDTDIDDDGLPM